jgi:Ca2+-binding RTX toxin-like protein
MEMVKKVGTSLADTLIGTALADELRGLGGNDLLRGLAGKDVLLGGTGDDRLFGREGNDLAEGGAGNDKIYGGDGNDTGRGGAGDDLVRGDGGDDKLFGDAGKDTVRGGLGNDLLNGGLGADILDGGAGIDTVSYADSTGAVQAYLWSNTSGLAAAGDVYVAVENVIGSAFSDFLQCGLDGKAFGGDGNDALFGAYGQEILRGDLGADLLRMDYGDTRAWVQLGKGADNIQYFIEDFDRLFVDLSAFGLGTTLDSNEISNSNTVTAFGTNAQFIYEDDAKSLWFDSNGTNAGGLTLIATFSLSTINHGNLGTNDFDFQL